MFQSLLIANRGEIACRIIATAHRMGLETIAVYSEADRAARHVALADRACCIGGPAAAESYLRGDAIVAAAREIGAEAIHPGYGFLAENADFADACAASGLVFVGPPPAAIRAMGEKDNAKRLMEAAGVAVVPGYHGRDQSAARLKRAAAEIGYPVLIKPVAGGGGKGMRRLDSATGFEAAVRAARREAKGAFGDGRLLIERFIERPRHIEVQVFADHSGDTIHLFERDCSIQRRHQKIIEEAPAPGITAALRARMGEAAVAAAKTIGYVGAGTVEFITEAVAPDRFYFMEMNTRLQVEHPVTEMITGLDLVEWQLRIAAGEPLPLAQDAIRLSGHAIEARLYAEDPENAFLPTSGRLERARLPAPSAHVRADTGYGQGDDIPVHYDPLIAKLIVWDADRTRAISRLRRALDATMLIGVRTNLTFLGAIARHKAFASGRYATDFVDRHQRTLAAPAPGEAVFAIVCLALLLWRQVEAAATPGDGFSPWNRTDGWRLNGASGEPVTLRHGDTETIVTAEARGAVYRLVVNGRVMEITGSITADGRLDADLDGRRMRADVVRSGTTVTVAVDGAIHEIEVIDPLAATALDETVAGDVRAPMPGRVVAVLVEAGQTVAEGEPLLIVEAMKMEHTVRAPVDGCIERVRYRPGDLVEDGADLIDFAPAAA